VKQITRITAPESIRQQVFAMAARGESHEDLSRYMASVKLEKVLAIRLLSQAAHIGLGEAKRIIHYSPAWAFRRLSDERFQDMASDALSDLKEHEPEGEIRAAKHVRTGTR
jgi:hypothetical protein